MSATVVRMKRIAVLSIVVALCLIGAASAVRADNYAYMAGAGGELGIVDLTTGTYTSISNTATPFSAPAWERQTAPCSGGQATAANSTR